MIWKLSAAAAAAALAGILAAAFTWMHTASAEMGGLRAQLGQTRNSQAALKREIGGLDSQMAVLSGTVSSLSVPTDPLSSYNVVCTIYANSSLGNSQPWYLPCTTSAETIPQPG